MHTIRTWRSSSGIVVDTVKPSIRTYVHEVALLDSVMVLLSMLPDKTTGRQWLVLERKTRGK